MQEKNEPQKPGYLTAVLYLRVSTAEQARRGGQAEGFSIPIQRERARAKAKELGATVIEEFVDAGKSATTTNRSGLQELLAYVGEHKPTYVIVYKIDRLARQALDSLVLYETFTGAGVQLVSCTEYFDNTPSGYMQFGFQSLINHNYSANLGEEMKSKLIGKIRSGGTIGRAAIGYLNTIERANGVEVRSVRVDEVRGPLMQWAFETYATGEWSLTSLTDALRDKGLTTVPSRKFAEKPIPRSTLARMLRNPYYTGVLVWKGVVYPGNHPALVSQQTFDAVQAVLDSHNVSDQKQRIHNHYLKGSVRCGQCGSTLCVTRSVNRHGTEYLYFFCLGNYRRYTTCDQRAIPVELVEAHIEKKWQSVQFDPDYADTIAELLTSELDTYRKRQERDKKRALKRRALLNEERLKLLNAHYMDAIPMELLKVEQDRITRELHESGQQLQAAEMSIERIEQLVRRSMVFLKNCYETYVMASPAIRRQLNQAMFEAFFVGTDGAFMARPTEFFRTLLRVDAVRVMGGRKRAPEPTELHDSRQWQDGVPAWLADAFKEAKMKKGSGGNRPTPVSLGMGLKEDYLAEGVGFEPTVPIGHNGFRDRPIRPLSHPSGRKASRPDGRRRTR
jgi:site-specific DNA recombinase